MGYISSLTAWEPGSYFQPDFSSHARGDNGTFLFGRHKDTRTIRMKYYIKQQLRDENFALLGKVGSSAW